LKTGNIPFS